MFDPYVGGLSASLKPFAQLTVYALALEHLTGIPLSKMKCAWFSHVNYNEFEPAALLRQ